MTPNWDVRHVDMQSDGCFLPNLVSEVPHRYGVHRGGPCMSGQFQT